MFLFAILFGLSMDYEVFLLGRVREEWERTGRPARLGGRGPRRHRAGHQLGGADHGRRLHGLRARRRVSIKMMGVGMAVAIAVDATLVRLVLVPSTMVLLGRWNWWLPAWLDRVLPAAHAPEPEVVAAEPERELVPA
jgi:RND superfamily putative drug exporter